MDFKSLCSFALFLPLFAFFGCILISIIKDFEHANSTHCGVDNILPSISASISSFMPQSQIWRLCIGIDSFPRYLIGFIYFNKYYYSKLDNNNNNNNRYNKQQKIYKILIIMGFIFHFIELTALLLLTYIGSIEFFFLHMISFILFLISSTLYMIFTLWSYYWIDSIKIDLFALNSTNRDLKSFKYKIRIFIFYIFSFLFSFYFYIRHNSLCEPYVYSIFAFFEYLTVLANIIYHSLIFYDLQLFDSNFKISFIEFNKND